MNMSWGTQHSSKDCMLWRELSEASCPIRNEEEQASQHKAQVHNACYSFLVIWHNVLSNFSIIICDYRWAVIPLQYSIKVHVWPSVKMCTEPNLKNTSETNNSPVTDLYHPLLTNCEALRENISHAQDHFVKLTNCSFYF